MPLIALIPLIQAGLSALAEGFRFLSTEKGQAVVADMLADKAAAKVMLQAFANRVDGWVLALSPPDKTQDKP